MSLQRRFKKKTPAVPATPQPLSEIRSSVSRGLHDEPHHSVPYYAEKWGLSDDTVRELFRNELGVLKIVRPEKMHKRGYVTLSIPESVAIKVHERLHKAA